MPKSRQGLFGGLIEVSFLFAVLVQLSCTGPQQRLFADEDFSYNEQPCWLNNPYTSKARGAIGIAGRYGASGKDLEKLSQHRAIKSVADMMSVRPPSEEELDASDSFRLGNEQVAVAPVWTYGNYHFAYAYIVGEESYRWVLEECPEQTCNPQSCDPSWLCNDGRDLDYASIVTVSQIAANLPTQYSLFFDNALDQVKAMFGVDVQAYERVSKTSDSTRRIGLGYVEDSSLEFAEGVDPHMVLANTCRVGTLYYARLVLKGMHSPDVNGRWNMNWHEELNSQSPGLEFGSFSGHLSRNLLSSKIMRAVKDALVKIARAEHINITSEEMNVRRTSGGGYYGQIINAKTEAKIEAKVRSVRFVSEGSTPTVYVLVENIGMGN